MTIARLVISFLFAVVAAPVDAAVFTVGADGACTHGNLLSAISAAAGNGAASDEIHVARNRTYTAIILPVVSHSVRVSGGYDTCADATPSGHTVIGGTAAGSNGTISTSGTAASAFTLHLSNLDLRDGGNVTSRRGGALRIEGSFEVTLDDVLVVDNLGARGGGIYIDGSDEATLTLLDGSRIDSNVAGISGGGIYCTAGGVISLSSALILDNIAQDSVSDVNESGNGGGVALYNGCRMFHAGTTGDVGLRNNVAARHGGGYYLRSADLFLSGTASATARVTNNEAADVGGGIAVNDDFTSGMPGATISEVGLDNSRIDNNRAARGGGIGLLVGGMVSMRRTLSFGTCHDATRCSTLSNNTSTPAAGFCQGAAVYAGLHSAFSLRQTLIENNCTTHGYAIDLAENARMRIESSVVARSGDRPFNFDESFDGTLDVAWSTIIGSAVPTRAAFLFLPVAPTATGDVRVFGSILGEAFEHLVVADGGGVSAMSTTFDCVLVDVAFTDPTAPVRALETTAPYGMLSPSTGNYRLASSTASVPVDFCDGSLDGRFAGDADGNVSVLDAPRANVFGIYDLGAYELSGEGAEAIFRNGFE